ncbi:tRNA(Met) cytidine acetyltransferase [Thalassomonas viridans]|uniref:tRNA(Met) cytidine acetyltransferase TmcA n=1 Tax=Thalassomonas viridans TaxID=137584 RepID=A0AAF0CDI7_9GAMM|nr:tRNA(Met) cytidine acetyltransferase [Thalassomonas viridans]
MAQPQFFSWVKSYAGQALAARQRRLVVLAGDTGWGLSLLKALPPFANRGEKHGEKPEAGDDTWLIYSDSADGMSPLTGHKTAEISVSDRKSYRHHLGTENTYLLFDGGEDDEGFNIDALAALSGTLVAGGILFLLLPQHGKGFPVQSNSIFLQRFFRELAGDNAACILEQGKPLPPIAEYTGPECPAQPPLALGCKTPEQADAVQNIIKVVKGHRSRPLVLTADRGRGKSSALAIAAAELLAGGSKTGEKMHIGITAPHLQACEVFFRQLQVSLPGAEFSGGRCVHAHGVIEFFPVDVLLHQQAQLGLLLVDEAAAIPVYLLQQLLACYHRMVFSTTIHGYEGAGRGFTLKFRQILQQQTPGYRALHVHQPIRWAGDDPLEAFIFRACLLKAALAEVNDGDHPVPHADERRNESEFLLLTPEDLLADEALLEQVFAVLVTAHYQTKPSDLKMLLDNPRMRIFCLKRQQQVLAVALLMLEGKAAADEVEAVKNSRRRLRDQFIPQSLMSHNGVDQAFGYSYLRIMRIAVHPVYQQQGLGSNFLAQLQEYGQAQQIDFIGSSFGANAHLLSFWLKGGYQLARIGFTPDASSGEHSALVLKALNDNGRTLQQDIHRQFYRSFDYLLLDEYQHLPVALIALILSYCPREYLPELSDFDRDTVAAFAARQRLFSSCVYSLHLWLKTHLSGHNNRVFYPLISRVLCKLSTSEVCRMYGFTGKKAFNRHLVTLVQEALDDEGAD